MRFLARLFLLTIFLLSFSVFVWGQGVGEFQRDSCSTITNPVAYKTFCRNQTNGFLYTWNGTAWVPTPLDGVINVMAYGAKGDNSTADSTSINNALTDAEVNGYEVIFPTPPVAYRINADLLITASVKIRCVGLGGIGGLGCQLHGDAGVNIFNISAGSGSIVQVDGQFYLNGGALGLKFAGASCRVGRESHFNNLDIGNQSDSGISIQNCGMIGTSFSNLNIFGQANYGIYAKTDAGTIQAFHNVLLENVRVSGTATTPNAAAVYIENSSAGSIAAEITFVNPIIESNGSRGLGNKGNIITLINPHFENNGADGTADIELVGIAGPQTLVTLISGSFSTPNAAQGNRRVLFSGTNARYHTLYTLISPGDKIDAASNISATSISQDYPPNNSIATILNYTGGATSFFDWSTTLRGSGGQGYLDATILKSPLVTNYGANGQATNIQLASALVNASNGAGTISATNLIPAGSLVVGVDSYVVTAFNGTLTSVSIGDGTTANLFSNTTGLTLGTATNLTNHLSTFATKLYTSNTSVVVTANGGTFGTTGAIRITVHYLNLTASGS